MEVLRPRQQWDVAVEPMARLEWVVVGCVRVVGLYAPGVLEGCVEEGVLCECRCECECGLGWMMRTNAFFRRLLYESEIDRELWFTRYYGSAMKGRRIPGNSKTTRSVSEHHSHKKILAISSSQRPCNLHPRTGTTFTIPAPHTTNDNTTHAVKKIVFHFLIPLFFPSTSY